MTAPARRQGGVALVLVMWVLTLLTVMALALTLSQRTESALSDNHITAARFRVLADAASAYTALQFIDSTATDTVADEAQISRQWLPDGTPHRWTFAGADLVIAVTNEASRVDLNQADQTLLGQLLEVLGVGVGDPISWIGR